MESISQYETTVRTLEVLRSRISLELELELELRQLIADTRAGVRAVGLEDEIVEVTVSERLAGEISLIGGDLIEKSPYLFLDCP